MLARVLEPEVMDSAEEARDYDAMDHGEVNRRFVDDLMAAGEVAGPVLDLGTGTARIPLELCHRMPTLKVVAVDAAVQMLLVAREHVDRSGLANQVVLECVDAKRLPYADGAFKTVISNSLVHHIPEPGAVLREAWRVLAPGGLFFWRDLERPADESQLASLVAHYAREASDRQRALLGDSLHASLTFAEVGELMAELGIPASSVKRTSDRHWTCAATKPVST